MQQKEIVRIIVGVLIAFVVGYAAGYVPEKQKNDDLRARVGKVFPGMSEMKEFGATIKEVRANSIIVTVPPSPSPLDEYPLEREVAVTGATKIILRTPLAPSAFQKIFTEFMAKSPSPTSTPPSPFIESTLAFKDLKAGDGITIKTASDVKFASSFEAKEIIESGTPPAPALPNIPPPPAQ